MIEPNTFICGDCKDVLEQLPDGFADLCLTDPPYGLGSRLHDGGTWSTNPIYDKMLQWDNEIMSADIRDQILRISKNQILWGGNLYSLPVSRCWLAWEKLEKMDTLGDFELAWTSFGSPPKQKTFRRNQDGRREHPTQKPVALFVWCLEKYSKPNDLIIDPFCGSGTTALACHKTGRRFICIDKDPDYIKIAKRRYAELIAQGDLFGSAPEQRQPQNSVQQTLYAM